MFGSRPTSASNSDVATIRLIRTVNALEARVQSLETRLRLVEQAGATPAVRRGKASFPDLPSKAAYALESECDDLTFLDPRGIRRFKTHCLTDATPAPCEPPFALDPSGIKRINPSCIEAPHSSTLRFD